MVKVERRLNPTCTQYNDVIVLESLKKDFHKKCYLCEEVTRHFEVDHFYPQVSHIELVNKYNNLFYCCQKCNKIKPKRTNTEPKYEIFNCCEIDVEKYIKLKLNIQECKIEISILQKNNQYSIQMKNTLEILDRIYNGSNSKSNACEDLREEIVLVIASFRKKLDKYQSSRLKRALEEEISKELNIVSSYSTFKRWIIRDNPLLNDRFKHYIGA